MKRRNFLKGTIIGLGALAVPKISLALSPLNEHNWYREPIPKTVRELYISINKLFPNNYTLGDLGDDIPTPLAYGLKTGNRPSAEEELCRSLWITFINLRHRAKSDKILWRQLPEFTTYIYRDEEIEEAKIILRVALDRGDMDIRYFTEKPEGCSITTIA